jgi:plasmid stabilization system protein ParE
MESRLRAVLIEKLISLSANYELGLLIAINTRETYAKFGRSRYVFRYRILENEVVILRIWHGREARE